MCQSDRLPTKIVTRMKISARNVQQQPRPNHSRDLHLPTWRFLHLVTRTEYTKIRNSCNVSCERSKGSYPSQKPMVLGI